MKSTRPIAIVSIASALLGAIACWLLIVLFGGEWKPVGDGRSVVNTRTGETRLSEDDGQPTLEAVQGRWRRSYVEDNQTIHAGLVVTPRSVTFIGDNRIDKHDTAPSRVIESGPDWYVVELQSLALESTYNSDGGRRSSRWRPLIRTVQIEAVDENTIVYDGETYKRFDGQQVEKTEWWKNDPVVPAEAAKWWEKYPDASADSATP